MTLQLPSNPHPPPQGQPEQRQPGVPPRSSAYDLITILVVGTAMAVVTVLVILFIQQNDDNTTTAATGTAIAEDTVITAQTLPPPASPSTGQVAAPAPTPAESITASTAAPTTTTATSATVESIDQPGTTVTAAPAVEQDPTQPFVWPQLTSEPRFITPEAAARSFAGFLAGYDDPTFSEFRQGDNRSGEIDVQPTPNGPVTVILLRQIGPEDTWAVIGATSENITINRPTAGANLANPITLTGRTKTPDGNLQYALYAHGQTEPIATGNITRTTDELEAFTVTIDWPDQPTGPGTLRLFTTNPNDGSIQETTIIPVRL